jgi:phosphopantetheinyl transferase
MKWLENSGVIELRRTDGFYTAHYSMVNDPLTTLTSYLSLLHPIERNYYDALKVDLRRYSYLLGRLAAKTAVSTAAGRQVADMAAFHIDFGVFKFPVVKHVPHTNIQVSITHCDEMGIALAFPEEHPLGIDIERVDAGKASAVLALLTPADHAQLSKYGMDNPAGYTLIWTVKESLSKLIKTGLTMDAWMMEVKSIERIGDYFISTFNHWLQYKAVSFFCGDYVCSITLPRNTTPLADQFLQHCRDVCQKHH